MAEPWLADLRDPVQIGRLDAQGFADIAHGGAKLVGGEGADLGDPVAVGLVDPGDQLLADISGEIQVDVGDGADLLVEEAPEGELVADRIDRGEADQVADDRADRRSATAAGGEVRGGPGGSTPRTSTATSRASSSRSWWIRKKPARSCLRMRRISSLSRSAATCRFSS